MAEIHRSTIGKSGESLVLATMLENGLEVYQATDDVRGIDFVARQPGCSFVEVQVKTIASKRDPEWFQLQTKEPIESLQKRPYFVVGVTPERESWIFPPEIYFDDTVANISTNEEGVTAVDLNLATTKRGASQTNKDRLLHLRDNWSLICERSRGDS